MFRDTVEQCFDEWIPILFVFYDLPVLDTTHISVTAMTNVQMQDLGCSSIKVWAGNYLAPFLHAHVFNLNH